VVLPVPGLPGLAWLVLLVSPGRLVPVPLPWRS
jgi:hypothetical protein